MVVYIHSVTMTSVQKHTPSYIASVGARNNMLKRPCLSICDVSFSHRNLKKFAVFP